VAPHTIDCYQRAHHRSTKVNSPLSHSHGFEFTNWWIESRHRAGRQSSFSKYLSNLAQSRPPSVSQHSLDHDIQVDLQTCSITASRCLPTVAWLQPPSLQHHGLQVHIPKLTWSRPPSASPTLLDHGLQDCTIMASKCISPNSHDHGLQVYLHTHSITASKFARSRPSSAPENLVDHYLGVQL